MPEMHLRHPDLHIVRVDHLQKKEKEHKHLKKQVIHDIFIKTILIKRVFNMKWLVEILKI